MSKDKHVEPRAASPVARRTIVRAAASVIAGAALLAACGSSQSKSANVTARAAVVATGVTAPSTATFCGDWAAYVDANRAVSRPPTSADYARIRGLLSTAAADAPSDVRADLETVIGGLPEFVKAVQSPQSGVASSNPALAKAVAGVIDYTRAHCETTAAAPAVTSSAHVDLTSTPSCSFVTADEVAHATGATVGEPQQQNTPAQALCVYALTTRDASGVTTTSSTGLTIELVDGRNDQAPDQNPSAGAVPVSGLGQGATWDQSQYELRILASPWIVSVQTSDEQAAIAVARILLTRLPAQLP